MNLQNIFDNDFAKVRELREKYVHKLSITEAGVVRSVNSGVVRVSGLPMVGYEELVRFKENLYGIVSDLNNDDVGVILLGDDTNVNVGDPVERTGRVMDVPVDKAFIGRIINPLGEPLDGGKIVSTQKTLAIERPAPAIIDREEVSTPLQTGIKVIDALIPMGRGQRELILGDRQTGKTAIAVDTIINQKDSNVICIYCAIGQRASATAKVIDKLRSGGAMEHTIVIATEGNNAPGLLYIAPYAATSIGEYFMEQGHDVLIVYDDLTQHARAYRELSLLLKRPPGREAYPGDIFHVHSRLLERSTQLGKELGGGSLSALPIIETEAQNISAYIPTNLISITDGQIYLSPKLFELGVLPAVDVGRSVSRVGGKAQLPVYQSVTGSLKLAYAQFEELETFARFGTHLDKRTENIIEHGKRIRACLKQNELHPLTVTEQMLVLLTLTNGLLDAVPVKSIPDIERELIQLENQLPKDLMDRLLSANKLTESDKESILNEVTKIVSAKTENEKKESGPEEHDESVQK